MADLLRIKNNVAKMAAQNAPEVDIDGYIASEGVTVDQVRDFRPEPGNVVAPSAAFTDAMAGASERSHFGPKVTTGLLENIGAGIDEGANAVLGAPVDLPVWLGNSLVNATNSGLEMAGAGRPIPNIPDDLPGSRKGWERTQEALGFTPPSDVVPADDGQKLARAASNAVTMAAVPEVAMIKAGQVASQLPRAGQAVIQGLGDLLGNSRTGTQFARNMTTNAAAGVGAEAAMQVAPDEWDPVAGLAGGLGLASISHAITSIPGGLRATGKLVGDYLAPLSQGGRERIAGDTLRDAATDIGAVRESLDAAPAELVPGSRPTTFQQTGDMGLGALERGVATKSPDEFMQRRADQNAAQVAAARDIQPTGAPEQVTAALRSQLEEIDARTYEAVRAATETAQGKAAAMGQGRTPEAAGEQIRSALETGRAAAKEQENALWAAVDPDGTLALSPSQTRAVSKEIIEQNPASARPIAGEEASIYGVIAQYGDTIPLRELSALHTRIKDEMRALRTNGLGETASYRRLTQLNNSVFGDLNEAVVAKVAQQAEDVAAGRMDEVDTIAAKLLSEIRAFGARKAETGTVSPTGLGGTAGGRSSGISRAHGAEVSGSRGLGNAPRDPRLSGDGLSANFDEDALGRLNTAREATQTRVNMFDNNTLKPIRQRPSTQSPYDMQAASVPGRIFRPGAKSFDDIGNLRRAVGDTKAMSMLQPYAVDRLRAAALREDGTFDPAKLATWRRSHSDALRAFPGLARKLEDAGKASEAMGEVAAARKLQIDEFQKGALGRVLGVEDPEDIVRTIGAIFSRQDRNAQFLRISDAIGGSSEAREGLRKAVVDYVIGRFVGNTEAATSGIGTIKSDMLQSFVKDNKGALRIAGFDDAEMQVMENIAKDLQQTNRSVASVKLPGGSNTAQDTFGIRGTDTPGTILSKLAAASFASGGVTSLVAGPVVGIPVGIATALTAAMRQAGLQRVDDLIKDAMLNPARAKYLLLKATPANVKMASTTLGQMYRRAALASLAAPKD